MKSVLRSKSFITFAALMSLSGIAHADLADLQALRTKDFLLGEAPTGCQPKGLKTDAEGRYAYVAEMCGKHINGVREATVSIYDLAKLSFWKTVVTPAGARGVGPTGGTIGNAEVEFTPGDQYILASRVEGDANSEVFPRKGMVTAIDAHTQEIKEFIPTNGTGSKIIENRPKVAGDDRQIVYVANYFTDDISVLDVTNMQNDESTDGSKRFITKIRLKSAFAKPGGVSTIAPRGTAFTADGRYGLVDASTTGSIMIIDSVNHKQIAELAPIPEDLGGVPLRQQLNGKSMNVRHIALTKDRKMAYLSHMRGDAISRISVEKLVQIAVQAHENHQAVIPSSAWHQLIVPFPNGLSVIKVPHYPKDAPPLYLPDNKTQIPIANKDWDLVRPNTIVLDPINNRYLYVSCRTDTDPKYTNYSTKTMGKVDIIDTEKGEVIFSLVGGAQPTALEVTPNNELLISGSFKQDKLIFFDLKKILNIYEH